MPIVVPPGRYRFCLAEIAGFKEYAEEAGRHVSVGENAGVAAVGQNGDGETYLPVLQAPNAPNIDRLCPVLGSPECFRPLMERWRGS